MGNKIKFRAWQDGQMLHQAGFGNYAISRFVGFVDNDSPLMQFTELQDKNDIDIYEDDFVSGSYLKPYGRFGQQKSIQFSGVVKYKFGQFYIKTGETKDGVDRCVYFSQLWPLSPISIEIEVKGNIHQEPELLKQESNG